MRVLITGNRGYIGQILARLLETDGHEVVGVDAGLFDACSFGKEESANLQRRDVRDLNDADLHNFEAIIHLAGLCNDPLGDLDPQLTDQINHRVSVELATRAKHAGVQRFLFASSCSIYGAAGDELIDESATIAPITPYARSKAEAETAIGALADDTFTPVFLRAATAYGVSARLRFDLVLNNFVAWACTSGVVRLKSDGSAWRPLVHVEDIAEAYRCLLVADRGPVHSQAFNVGRTDQNIRIVDLAATVARIIPNARVETDEGAGPDQRSYRVNCDKLPATVPAYRPRWELADGAAQVREACERFSLVAGSFESKRFNRLEHLRSLLTDGSLDRDLRWHEP